MWAFFSPLCVWVAPGCENLPLREEEVRGFDLKTLSTQDTFHWEHDWSNAIMAAHFSSSAHAPAWHKMRVESWTVFLFSLCILKVLMLLLTSPPPPINFIIITLSCFQTYPTLVTSRILWVFSFSQKVHVCVYLSFVSTSPEIILLTWCADYCSVHDSDLCGENIICSFSSLAVSTVWYFMFDGLYVILILSWYSMVSAFFSLFPFISMKSWFPSPTPSPKHILFVSLLSLLVLMCVCLWIKKTCHKSSICKNLATFFPLL